MTLAESFATYLQNDLSIATIGQDLYLGGAPSSNKAPDSIWWIIASGGAPTLKAQSGEFIKGYTLEVYYRNRDGEVVYDKLQDLEARLNTYGCPELTDFEVVEVEATTFPVDNDLDSADRKVGLLEVTLTTYKED